MKKVLYMTQWDSDATAYYRITPLRFLNNPDISVERKYYHGTITWEVFMGFDILFLERPSGHNDLSLIKLAKQCGLKVILDYDDDILHLDQYNPMWATYEGQKSANMECMILADEIWVSTDGVKKSFSMYNKNIQVIPNAHNDYLQAITAKKPFNEKTKKCFWRGGQSHEADVYDVANGIIKAVNRNIDWSFQIIGCRFIYLEQRCGNNYQPVSQMPLIQYFNHMSTGNPNILFHPLSETVFNKGKSNIAWLEGSFAGAAFFGNKNLPEFNKDCILPIDLLGYYLKNKSYEASLSRYNSLSWELICDELLLSKVNKIREERILAL